MSEPNIVSEIARAIVDLELEKAQELVNQALSAGVPALKIINEGIVAGLTGVGEKFEQGEYFLAELTMAGQMAQKLINTVKPHLPAGQALERKKVVIGTVKGDLHDIGKNLVALMLSSHGYEVYDLGKDVPTMDFINKVREVKADVLGLSALMQTTLAVQKEVIQYLKDMGLRDTVKVIVGGGPTTRTWAESIGADGWAPDAFQAVVELDKLLGIQR